jgi:NADH dehydrogenase
MSLHAVTGAFGYSGKYIARRLLDAGQQILTLTNSPQRSDRIRAFPFNFDKPDELTRSLEGVSVLYNTIINAIGPETFTYRGLVEKIGEIIGRRRMIVSVPPGLGYVASRVTK